MNLSFKELATMCPIDTDEEIAKLYKVEPENRNMFIAKIYTKYVSYLTWYNKKDYYTFEDKESILLEVIHTALLDFDESRGVLFKTLLSTYLKNRFRYEDEYVFAKSRIWYANTLFASGMSSNGEDDAMANELLEYLAGGEEDEYVFEMSESIKTLSLSENQYKYCEYVMSLNYIPTDTEVSEFLGISKSGVAVIKWYLKEKLKHLL